MFTMYKRIIFSESFYGLYTIGIILLYPILILVSFLHYLRKCWKYLTCNQNSIKNEVALITGSARGLGRCLAIALAKRGCHIAIVDVQGELAEETAKFIAQTYGVQTKAYKIDVTDFQQLEDLKRKITNDIGDVTILINNAGILMLSSTENPPPQEVQRMVNVNFTAIIYTTQLFLPKMMELNHGHIVNISSIAAITPLPSFNVYAATKAAVRSLTASLRVELMHQHCQVTATTVMPTCINTNPKLVKLLKIIDENDRILFVEGDMVAEYIVKAMLCGDDEVTVPRTYLCMYKLLELLPAYALEKFIALSSQYNWKNFNTQEFKKFLETSDIQTDM